ncbi:hypothetical protein EHI8A_100200 [Entamoeba histolytica HM-1:IMSS-B]|uniref:Uncharacterized protein n=3 Tax=Entamoeba histolytica TaxID=5759 RepID=A0A175JF02_ENTHI|nr:hypothetical protein EHI8A_100200 [Entamoeba histolytica HM-1:IMSS-B]EMS16757.1 hypothetical protein KM1_148980 [Entamoeba histolytica HM-3:IMSS]GAT92260.1 hypothetical protein CL6EHI_049730 [Entamoeba histolytica]
MISDWTFSYRIGSDESTYQYMSCVPGLLRNKILLVPNNNKQNQTLFEMIEPDVLSQTCCISVSSILGVPCIGKNMRLTYERTYPFKLTITEKEKGCTRWQLKNGILYAYLQEEKGIYPKKDEEPFGQVGLICIKNQNYFCINTPLLFSKMSLSKEITLTSQLFGKDYFYLCLLNEIPNKDIIPGTPFFRVILHCKKQRRSVISVQRNENCEPIIRLIGTYDSTAKLVHGKWYLGLYENSIVWGDESDSIVIRQDKYGKLNVLENGKCVGYVELGEKRDDESYYLVCERKENIQFVALTAIMIITDERRDGFIFTDGCWLDNEQRYNISKAQEIEEEFFNSEDIDQIDEELDKEICITEDTSLSKDDSEIKLPTEEEIV